jgi:hypothetical protein
LRWLDPRYDDGEIVPRERLFDDLVRAVRFAMETLPIDRRDRALIESDGERYDIEAIGGIYHRADFPAA